MPRYRYWTVVQYVLDARRAGGMLAVAFANHLNGPAGRCADCCQQGRFPCRGFSRQSLMPALRAFLCRFVAMRGDQDGRNKRPDRTRC